MKRAEMEQNNMMIEASSHKPAYTCNGQPVEATEFYAIACDPRRSVAIEACAGAGKTWMLVSRILRALLEGAKPESILAITYTKKAAGEMRERLFEWLRDFAYEEDDNQLLEELINRGVAKKDAVNLIPRLRLLHAELLNQSKTVEIRTFHSWFAQLLGAAPLGVLHDLGLPVQYDLIEDDSELFMPTWYALLEQCTHDDALKADLYALLQQQGAFNTQEALRAAWSRRLEFALADEHGIVENGVEDAPDPCTEVMQDSFKLRWYGYATLLGTEKNKTPQAAASNLGFALTSIQDPVKRLEALRNALFVKTEDRLNSNLAKFEAAQHAEVELVALLQQHAQHQAYQYQQRMMKLTRAFLVCYAKVKREQNIVDMADLERAAMRLLGDTETYGWVAQRLDARINQVLIDEFQDTNPLQWQALRGWLSAYGGAGGGSAMSIFIVGDPKQSIYRFRRADPTVFIAACDFLQHTLGGSKLACDHTRRNAPEVIESVNAVFEKAQREKEYDGFRAHTTAAEQRGEVARLPMILREEILQSRDSTQQGLPLWRDSLVEPRYMEEEKLRMQEIKQVAGLIQRWIREDGWQPADIKVLSRRKDRLRELLLELNHKRIPWRFADDVHLIETLEVQDLVALLDVLASPVNDLSLAQVLHSPIFNLNDEDLMLLALKVKETKREQEQKQDRVNDVKTRSTAPSWWEVLSTLGKDDRNNEDEAGAELNNLYKAAQQLKQWAALAHTLPPHDLLDAIYNQAQILESYAKAVPVAMRESVLANLRAFLQHSLTLDSGRYATPYNFVRTLRNKGIKSEHPEDSETVELLTIHGAKGLEARGIIILDSDPTPTRADRLSVLMDWPAEARAPTQFIFYINTRSLPPDAQDLAAKEDAADAKEELNALYVAMTRARERLVFSALQASKNKINEGNWWYRLVNAMDTLELTAPQLADKKNEGVSRSVEAFALESLINIGPKATEAALKPFQLYGLPRYLREVNVEEGGKVQSEVYEMLQAETGALGVARATLASQNKQTQAQRFGDAVHRLLELETTELEVARNVAQEMGLTPQQIIDAVAKAEAIMTSAESKHFFDLNHLEEVQKEVGITYLGQPYQIDRLVKIKGQWWIIDFKSAANPLKEYGEEYKQQLVLYKKAVEAVMPNEVVHTAIIAGDGRVIEL